MVLTSASFTLSVSFSSMIWSHSSSEISSVYSFMRTFDNSNSSFTFSSRITLGFMQKKCSSAFCSEWNRVFSWLVVMSITLLNTSTWKRFSPDSSLESLESSSKNFLTWGTLLGAKSRSWCPFEHRKYNISRNIESVVDSATIAGYLLVELFFKFQGHQAAWCPWNFLKKGQLVTWRERLQLRHVRYLDL